MREKKCLSLNKTKAMGGRGFANMTIRRALFPPLTSSVISMIRTRSNDKTGERPARPLDLCNVVQGLSCSSHPTSSAVWGQMETSQQLFAGRGVKSNLLVRGTEENSESPKVSCASFYNEETFL